MSDSGKHTEQPAGEVVKIADAEQGCEHYAGRLLRDGGPTRVRRDRSKASVVKGTLVLDRAGSQPPHSSHGKP